MERQTNRTLSRKISLSLLVSVSRSFAFSSLADASRSSAIAETARGATCVAKPHGLSKNRGGRSARSSRPGLQLPPAALALK